MSSNGDAFQGVLYYLTTMQCTQNKHLIVLYSLDTTNGYTSKILGTFEKDNVFPTGVVRLDVGYAASYSILNENINNTNNNTNNNANNIYNTNNNANVNANNNTNNNTNTNTNTNYDNDDNDNNNNDNYKEYNDIAETKYNYYTTYIQINDLKLKVPGFWSLMYFSEQDDLIYLVPDPANGPSDYIHVYSLDNNSLSTFHLNGFIHCLTLSGGYIYALHVNNSICKIEASNMTYITCVHVPPFPSRISTNLNLLSPEKLIWTAETGKTLIFNIPELTIWSTLILPAINNDEYEFEELNYQGASAHGELLLANNKFYDISIPNYYTYVQDAPEIFLYEVSSMAFNSELELFSVYIQALDTNKFGLTFVQYAMDNTLWPSQYTFNPQLRRKISNMEALPLMGGIWYLSVADNNTYLTFVYIASSVPIYSKINLCPTCSYFLSVNAMNSSHAYIQIVLDEMNQNSTIQVFEVMCSSTKNNFTTQLILEVQNLVGTLLGTDLYLGNNTWILTSYQSNGRNTTVYVYQFLYGLSYLNTSLIPSIFSAINEVPICCTNLSQNCFKLLITEPKEDEFEIILTVIERPLRAKIVKADFYNNTVAISDSYWVGLTGEYFMQTFVDQVENRIWVMVPFVEDGEIFIHIAEIYPNSGSGWDVVAGNKNRFWVNLAINRCVIITDNTISMSSTLSNSADFYAYTAPNPVEEFELYLQGSTILMIAVVNNAQLSWTIISDCPKGYQVNRDVFCSVCTPGTFGLGCQNCIPGYVCDEYGLTTPDSMCPEGHYCVSGTNTLYLNTGYSPQICDAGTYCSAGIGSPNPEDVYGALICAPGYYCPRGTSVLNHKCPSNTDSVAGGSLLDNCTCNEGWYGFEGNCIQCPSTCTCKGDIISDCWLDPSVSLATVSSQHITPSQCIQYSLFGQNPCNPTKISWRSNSSIPFPCQEGYTSRLCSQCEEGYYSSGRECGICNHNLKYYLPIVYSSGVLLLCVYAWNISPGRSAMLKIIIFHFQSLSVLVMGGLEWNKLATKFYSGSSEATGGGISSLLGVECLMKFGLFDQLLVSLLIPIFLVILGFITAGCNFIKRRIRNQDTSYETMRPKVVKLVSILLSLCYFNVAQNMLNVFGCTSVDTFSNKSYLSAHPYIECYDSKWFRYLTVATVGLCFEVIGLPALLFFYMKSHHHDLHDNTHARQMFESFVIIYTPKNYYWEMVITIKRLAIAILVAVVPFNDPVLLAGIVMVLLCYLILQLKLNPYVMNVDNIMDHFSHCVLLLTLIGGLLISLPIFSSRSTAISLILLGINCLFGIIGGGLIIIEYSGTIIGVITKLKQRCFGNKPERERLLHNVVS